MMPSKSVDDHQKLAEAVDKLIRLNRAQQGMEVHYEAVAAVMSIIESRIKTFPEQLLIMQTVGSELLAWVLAFLKPDPEGLKKVQAISLKFQEDRLVEIRAFLEKWKEEKGL